MSGFVADASVTLAWCFSNESTPFTMQLLDRVFAGERITVPAHWPIEVLNGLMRAKRRGRVTEAEIQYFLKNLRSFDLSIERGQGLSLLDNIRTLADRYNLTAYDAAYLELALRSGLQLATLDDSLRMAATIEGIAVV
jgi:predicted nucleic acid-binding protein